ncbi:kelch repeat and BTB domain-containing protein 12-like isoform X2 [Planococcus citri]|uniref:kelch repeat and BTB domain-containing protein 12-like isoform X2 n=1 Tax=Planococcus citri TaxID=170843 RepID=UPI0031F9826D
MDDSVKTVDLDHFQKKSFQQNMNDLRLENVLCDVRLDVNGTIMPCHRLVLAAASPYFRTMFNGNFKESNSDTIVLKDIDTETVQEILNAIYTATIRFKPSNAYFILMASHLWQLEMIENACVSYIMENPKIHHMVDTCVFANNIGIENTFKILNRNNGWFIFHAKKMKDRRPEVCIFHYENSLYMVENGRVMVPNEKCDLSSYKWTELPHLPQKITISGTNDVVAIGEVFGVEVNAQ